MSHAPDELALGITNYEAYAGAADWVSLVNGERLPPFEQLPEVIQHAWIVAAVAVRNAIAA